jgi:hypothetical protein
MSEVGKQVFKATKKQVQDTLRERGVPNILWDLVETFLTPLLPFTKTGHPINALLRGDKVTPLSSNDISDLFQDLYSDVEGILRSPPPVGARRKDDAHQQRVLTKSHEKEGSISIEKIREVIEVIEEVLCATLYDRLFRPEGCDDWQHDEALASRVAALNLLDLTLEHLGVDAKESGGALSALIKKCGESMLFLSLISTALDVSVCDL